MTETTDTTQGDEIKRLVGDLSETLQRSLSESPQLAQCLSRVKAAGYEVSLLLEATIGLSRTGVREPPAAETARFDFRVEKAEPARVKMTPLDKKFLRSLKISVEEDE